jgi:hypothetical protein
MSAVGMFAPACQINNLVMSNLLVRVPSASIKQHYLQEGNRAVRPGLPCMSENSTCKMLLVLLYMPLPAANAQVPVPIRPSQ